MGKLDWVLPQGFKVCNEEYYKSENALETQKLYGGMTEGTPGSS